MLSSRGSSQPRDQIQVSHNAGRFFYHMSHQGGVFSWYDHIPYLLPTYWKIIISQRFSHRSESFEPQVRLPSLGTWHWEEEPPEHLALKASGLECRHFTELGETETPLLEGAQEVSHALGPRAKQWLHRSMAQAYLWVGLRRQRVAVSHCGRRTLVAGAPGNIHWSERSQKSPIWHWDLAPVLRHLRPNHQQGGNTAPPSADRLYKVSLNPQPPINIPLDTVLPTRGTRPSSTHQWAGTSSSHLEACTGPWTNLIHWGADTRRRTTILQPEEWRPQTQKIRQNETAGGYVPDEETRYNPRITTKWSGDRQSTWKRIHSNNSKNDPRSQKKNGGTDWEDTRNV